MEPGCSCVKHNCVLSLRNLDMCKHNLCSLKMQDSLINVPAWDFERWNPKTKVFPIKRYFNNCHPAFLSIAFSTCRGTNKHQWRWRKSVWTRHYVGGNFLSELFRRKKIYLAKKNKEKPKDIFDCYWVYKNTWYERVLMMHYLEKVLEIFFISTKVRECDLTQYSSKNKKNSFPVSIKCGSVAFLLLVEELDIIWSISSRTNDEFHSAESR